MKLATPNSQRVSLYVRMCSCGGAQLLGDAQLCTQTVTASEFVGFRMGAGGLLVYMSHW